MTQEMGSSISTDLNVSACCSFRKERSAYEPEEDDAPTFGLPDSCLGYRGNDEVNSGALPDPSRVRRGLGRRSTRGVVSPQGASAAEKRTFTKVGRVQDDGDEATPVSRLGSRVLTGHLVGVKPLRIRTPILPVRFEPDAK